MLFWGKASSNPAVIKSWTYLNYTSFWEKHHRPVQLNLIPIIHIIHIICIIHIMNIIHHFGKRIIRQCSQTIFSEKVNLSLIILLGPDILHSNSEHTENLFTLSIFGKASTLNKPNHKKERFILCWRLPYKKCSRMLLFHITKQDRMHGYPGRVQVDRGRI